MIKTNPFNIAYTLALTLLLNTSFTMIFAGTFHINLEIWQFMIFMAIFAIVFLILNLRKKVWYGLIGLGASLITIGIFAYTDTFIIQSVFLKIIAYLKYIFIQDAEIVMGVEFPGDMIAMLFAFMSVVPSYLVTWALLRRHTIAPAMLWYAIYFVPAIMDSYNSATTVWYVIAALSVTLMVLYECMRKLNPMSRDYTISILSIPVLLICLITCIVFPMKSYKLDQLAATQYEKILTAFDRTFHTDIKRFMDMQRGGGPTQGIDGTSVVRTQSTDLTKEGQKDSSEHAVMLLQLTLFDDTSMVDVGDIYLRASSMSIFSGSAWNRDVAPLFSDDDQLHRDFDNIEYATGGSLNVAIFDDKARGLEYVPCNAGTSAAPGRLVLIETSNSDDVITLDPIIQADFDQTDVDDYTFVSKTYAYPYPECYTATEIATFETASPYYYFSKDTWLNHSYSIRTSYDMPAPLPEWSKDYLWYTDNICTFVPETTKQAILDSGVLPDWYISVMNGEIEMTDGEKVTAVMNYVYHLKPYDVNTPVMPEGEDFVTWFMTKAQSGYCVHYATTSAVLLRMLGVPTRYVTGYTTVFTKSDTFYPTADTEYDCLVTENNAHSWCEFFDPDYGWIEFDPTNNIYVPSARPYTPATNVVETQDFQVELHHIEAQKQSFEEEEKIIEKQDDNVKKSILSGTGLVIVCLLAILAFVVVRLADIISWRKKFTTGSNNDRVRALCRYSMFLADRSEVPITEQMTKLTEIAMFSRDGVSDADLDTMLICTRDYVNRVIKSKSTIKRVIAYVVHIVQV